MCKNIKVVTAGAGSMMWVGMVWQGPYTVFSRRARSSHITYNRFLFSNNKGTKRHNKTYIISSCRSLQIHFINPPHRLVQQPLVNKANKLTLILTFISFPGSCHTSLHPEALIKLYF